MRKVLNMLALIFLSNLLCACATLSTPSNIGIGAAAGTLAGATTGNPMIMAGGAIIGAIGGYSMPSTDKQHEKANQDEAY